MLHPNLLTRRRFLSRSASLSLGVALSSLVDIPLVMKRALADGNFGGKKLLFIFLRGANDGLNSLIPVLDDAYYNQGTVAAPKPTRPDIGIDRDPAADYAASGRCADLTAFLDAAGTAPRGSADATFGYANAIPVGNGFAGLHPALKFLAPVYNDGQLALIHRVAYPRQSRSHFDSQNYWETGNPNNKLSKDGLFYRMLWESGLTKANALTGVSIQSSLPLILRGSKAAMTNLSDPNRYSLLGLPHPAGEGKTTNTVGRLAGMPAPDRMQRELLELQYQNLASTLAIFGDLDFTESGNTYQDDVSTDADQAWFDAHGGQGYYLFPTTSEKNGGWRRPDATTRADKMVVPAGAQSYFSSLKAAAMVLNHTDAVIAGTEIGGFDTHNNQGGATGSHADLQKRIAWSMYALKKYFTLYGQGGARAGTNSRVNWKDVVVVTLSEFGRTTVQNSNNGTDHAEAGAMFVAGGSVRGFQAGARSGVFGCHPSDVVPWVTGPTGSMFGVSGRYLKRAVDYRCVLGELIRDHLGATPDQLGRIIPGYTVAEEHLIAGGVSTDGVPILGELDLI